MPSLTALLALLALAGYQNRDKLGELLGKAGLGLPQGEGSTPAPQAGTGSVLGDLLDGFKKGGMGEATDSWVGTGPNKPISPPHVEQGLGSDVIDALMRQTGLSREELLGRLSQILPEAVDKSTPEGRLPA